MEICEDGEVGKLFDRLVFGRSGREVGIVFLVRERSMGIILRGWEIGWEFGKRRCFDIRRWREFRGVRIREVCE